MIEPMIDSMIEHVERKGFVLAPDSMKILVVGGSIDARRLPCR
jgi:hypothetical protein